MKANDNEPIAPRKSQVLRLLAESLLVACWTVGIVWAASYRSDPAISPKIGLTALAVAILALVLTRISLTSVPRSRQALLPIFAFVTFAINVVSPAVMGLDSASAKSGCLHNVEELGFAMQLYTSDYDDRFPLADSWRDVTNPYRGTRGNDVRCPRSEFPYTYAMNKALSGLEPWVLDDPNHAVTIFECGSFSRNAAGEAAMFSKRHNGKGSIFLLTDESKFTPTLPKTPLRWHPKQGARR